jgi:hypothetical protein
MTICNQTLETLNCLKINRFLCVIPDSQFNFRCKDNSISQEWDIQKLNFNWVS